MIKDQIAELEKQYRWKAENIVRFILGLDLTKEQQISFVAYELAMANWLGYVAGGTE